MATAAKKRDIDLSEFPPGTLTSYTRLVCLACIFDLFTKQLGLAPRSKVERGFASRVPKAYPIYDADYAGRVQAIRDWLDGIENLQQVGRNGLHRYNNSDHSMLTAMRAVDNLVAGAEHDIWAVNVESVYHETDVPDEHPYRTAPKTPDTSALAASRPES